MMLSLSARGGMPSLHSFLVVLLSLSTITTAHAGRQFLLDEDATVDSSEEGFTFPYRIDSVTAQASGEGQFPATVAELRIETSATGANWSAAEHNVTLHRDQVIAWLKDISGDSIKIEHTRAAYEQYSNYEKNGWADEDLLVLDGGPKHAKTSEVQLVMPFVAVVSDLSLVNVIVRSLASEDTNGTEIQRVTYGVSEDDRAACMRELHQKTMQDLKRKIQEHEEHLGLLVTSIEDLNIDDYWPRGSDQDLYNWDSIKSRYANGETRNAPQPSVRLHMNLYCKLRTERDRKHWDPRVVRGTPSHVRDGRKLPTALP